MTPTRLVDLVPALQVAVAPVILISGVGLLLLSLTNRFGRAVDRARHLRMELAKELGRPAADASDMDRRRLTEQVENLYRRAQWIQTAIIFAASSVLCAALLIVTLFVETLLKWESAVVIAVLFVLCLLALITSLVAFILDIRLSLAALKMELRRH